VPPVLLLQYVVDHQLGVAQLLGPLRQRPALQLEQHGPSDAVEV
jgi:hypothetical protein